MDNNSCRIDKNKRNKNNDFCADFADPLKKLRHFALRIKIDSLGCYSLGSNI